MIGLITSATAAPGVAGHAPRAGHSRPAPGLTARGPLAYVVNARGGTVTPIATATNAPGEPIEVGIGRCFRSAAWLADLRGDGRLFWFGDGGFGRWSGEPLR